jgi:hypothetical protein
MNFKKGAEKSKDFLRYVFYSIDKKLLHPRDVAYIIGPWLKDYYDLKIRLNKKDDLSEECLNEYFPKMPKILLKEIETISYWLDFRETAGENGN